MNIQGRKRERERVCVCVYIVTYKPTCNQNDANNLLVNRSS